MEESIRRLARIGLFCLTSAIVLSACDHGSPTETGTAPTPTSEASESVGICERTPKVREAILWQVVGGYLNCADVTSEHLASIGGLNLRAKTLTSLQEGDFDGLTSLNGLNLSHNRLETPPEGIFDELYSLTRLHLEANELSTPPQGAFDQLTMLSILDLSDNSLELLTTGIFDELSSLSELYLGRNPLTLEPELFDGLPRSPALRLDYRQLVSLGLTATPVPH